jgi:hypothetical protein
MSTIDDLINTLTAQSQAAMGTDTSPWQQELLETINPEKQRRRNIAKAIQQASLAMAQTRGSVLDGLSAAAATGAGSYITGQQESEDYAAKVKQAMAIDQTKQQDRRMAMLLDAIGVKRNQEADERDKAESKAKIAWYERRGVDTADGSLSPAQAATNKRFAFTQLGNYESELRRNLVPEDQIPGLVQQKKAELEQAFGVSLDGAQSAAPQVGAADPNVTQFDLMTNGGGQSPGITSDAEAADGITAVNPQTGERVVYRNGQWLPL